MKAEVLTVQKIVIPDYVRRDPDKVGDDLLRKSIEHGGVQQPLVVVKERGTPILVDGLRRIRQCNALGVAKATAVIDVVPKGQTTEEYIRKIRFVLDEHRQDLLPSQKAELIETLQRMFGMKKVQVAAYLGVDPDSITNWLAVKKYVPEVVTALDSGALTMQAARAFDGMTEEGQKKVFQRHGERLMDGGGKLHREIRAQYPPEKFPKMYRDPQLIASRLARTSGKRKAKARVQIPADEKKLLLNSLEMKEAELREGQQELKELKAEIAAATPIVAALTRNEKLWALVSEEMRAELERFSEIYV